MLYLGVDQHARLPIISLRDREGDILDVARFIG